MGGTFDPIHYGHLLVGEEAWQAFGLDQIVFVPTGRPNSPKAPHVNAPEHRYAMTALATQSNPRFACSRLEIDRPGPSYTLETVRAFRQTFPELKALYFITGADIVRDIPTWHNAEELIEECRFIAVTRPGFVLEQWTQSADADFLDRVAFLPIPGLDISSTDLRRRAQEGRSLRYLTPEPVADYIRQNGLYRKAVP